MTPLKFRKFYIQKDLGEMYQIMTNPEEQMAFQAKLAFNSNVEYEQWLLDQMRFHYHDFYVLEEPETGKFAGFLYSYDFRQGDGHCMICVYVKPEYRRFGAGAAAGLRFMDELFREYPLRKIYVTIYDYNNQSLKSNLHAGFQEEGCYREYRYYDGKYWDMHLLAMTREAFRCVREKFVL